MENYQEQYNQELHQQEINSNLRTLKGYFWIVVTMLVLWLLTLTRIFIVDAGIFTMAVGANFIGDGLRDLLDPKLRKRASFKK